MQTDPAYFFQKNNIQRKECEIKFLKTSIKDQAYTILFLERKLVDQYRETDRYETIIQTKNNEIHTLKKISHITDIAINSLHQSEMQLINSNDENLCSICLQSMTSTTMYKLTCQHCFHFKCFMEFQKHRGSSCPMCRSPFQDGTVISSLKN